MSLPYFPFYVADFMLDTQHLTDEEIGIYMRLLMLSWNEPHCRLRDDQEWLLKKTRQKKSVFLKKYVRIISEFFVTDAGFIYNRRLLKEWQEAETKHKRRVEAGRKGGSAKSSNAKAKPKQLEPEPELYSNRPSQQETVSQVGTYARETDFGGYEPDREGFGPVPWDDDGKVVSLGGRAQS